MRAFCIFSLLLCVGVAYGQVSVDQKVEQLVNEDHSSDEERNGFVLLSKEERKKERTLRKTFEFKESLEKGIVCYEITVTEYIVKERRRADVPARMGEKVVRIYDKYGHVIPGEVKVTRTVKEEQRGSMVVLVGFKRPLATGEKLSAKVKRLGVYKQDGESLAVYQVVR